jgi:large subunit ribosomal protein L47
LTERYYSWREAEFLAQKDPEITYTEDGLVYTPQGYTEDDVVDEDVPVEVTEEEAIRADEAMEQNIASEHKQTEKSTTL